MLDLLDVLCGESKEVLDLDAYQCSPSALASCWALGRTGLKLLVDSHVGVMGQARWF